MMVEILWRGIAVARADASFESRAGGARRGFVATPTPMPVATELVARDADGGFEARVVSVMEGDQPGMWLELGQPTEAGSVTAPQAESEPVTDPEGEPATDPDHEPVTDPRGDAVTDAQDSEPGSSPDASGLGRGRQRRRRKRKR
jgi:hypothetical protein